MRKMQKKWKQWMASFLVVTMFATSVSLEAFATENTGGEAAKAETASGITTSENQTGNYKPDKADIIQSELTADSTTYDAGNGKKITEFYSQDVRFKDEEGKLTDYDPTLIKIQNAKSVQGHSLKDYAYENRAGDKKQYFPEELTEDTPILMEYGKYRIRLAPSENLFAEGTKAEVETETFTDIYEKEKSLPVKAVYSSEDENISYQYTSTDIGVKEEIVLEEKPDTNVFTSAIEIPGLTIRKNVLDEGFTIYDGDEIVAGIQAPNMNDATGEAYSEEASYELKVIDEESGKYELVLTVEEAYLNDENRQYPVTIDPTITWSGNTNVCDVYVLSGSTYKDINFYDSGITAFHAGKVSQGISRTYIAFASISALYGRYVESAKLVLTESTSSDASQTVNAYRVTESWSKSKLTWNNKPAYNTTVLSSIKTKGTNKTKYTLNLTTLFRGYAKKTYSNYGILLKNPTETGKHGRFYGARVSTTDYRPKLTIVHYDPPTKAESVVPSPRYIKKGSTTKVTWAGITAKSLSYFNYRLANYDYDTKTVLDTVIPYSTSTKIGGATATSGTVSACSEWDEGIYMLYVRGVDTSGVAGPGKGCLIYIDGTPPKGTIDIYGLGDTSPKKEEIPIVQGTMQIVVTADGTYSKITDSSLKLYDNEGNFVKTIYTKYTTSTTKYTYTPELPNGQYTLRLYLKDSVGYTATIDKNIEIVNKLTAPEMSKIYTDNNTAQIPWEFNCESGEVHGLAYKLPGNNTWTKVTVDDTSKTSGTLSVTLPDEDGIYDITVCGIDKAGSLGEEAHVECIFDSKKPELSIDGFDRGVLTGTIQDSFLDSWDVMLKKSGAETETNILSGKENIQNSDIGLIDLSKLENNVSYELKITGRDKAGNIAETIQEIKKTGNEILAEVLEDEYRIGRTNYNSNTAGHIVYPQKQKELILEGSVPEGNIYWFSDNQKVSEDSSWILGDEKEEGEVHSILAVVRDNAGNHFYSRSRIKNRELLALTEGTEIELPEGCVSFRLNTGSEQVSINVSIDGGEEQIITSGQTYHISQLTGYEQATAATVEIINDSGQNVENWILEADCISIETYEFSEIENYHPSDVSAADKLNYKTYLKWKGVEGNWPDNLSYEIYRSKEVDFEPSEKTLIASDVKANYWAEMNVNFSKTFYYRIRAVRKDSEGNIIKTGSYSKVVGSKVIDENEYTKRMGLKEYWEYAEFETPSGNGYIEKSRGNLVYIQADAAIPNEQLPVTLERAYNSQSTAKTAFGEGWTHSFDIELLNICKNDSLNFNNIVLKDGTGTLYFYVKLEDGTYVSSMEKFTKLVKEDKTQTVELPEKEVGVSDKKKTVEVISAFTVTTKDNVEYYFNSSGQMVFMKEANGNFLLFEYETDKGLLSKVITNRNLTMDFIYHAEADGKDLLTVKEIRLPDGSRMSYDYNAKGRLTGVTQVGTDKQSEISWSMEYENGKMTSVTDAKGHPYTISYDREKAVKASYPNEDAIKLVYDTENEKTTTYKTVTKDGQTTDILLETNLFEESSGNCLNMTDSKGNTVDYEYADDLLQKTSFSTTYQTVEDGKIREYKVNKENAQSSETNTYDSRYNLTKETDEDGITTTYEYGNTDEKRKDLPTRRIEKDAEGTIIADETYTYDNDGNVTRIYDAVGGLTTVTTYHTKDSTSQKSLKGEIATETEYVGEGQHNKVTTSYSYSYDSDGNKTEVMTEESDDLTVTTTTVYDVMGREISSTDTLGTTTATEYDPFGRISKITITQGTGENKETDVVTREYDDNGTLVKEVDEDGTIYTYSYDSMNRVTAEGITKGDSDVKTWTTSYRYGDVTINTGKGKETIEHVLITEEKNPGGDILAVTYTDTLGNVVREKANGLYTDYVYDREDKLTFRCVLGTDVDNEDPIITAYLYDASGNNTHQILHPEYDEETDIFLVTQESLTQSMTYDSTGNVLSAKDAMGNTTSYAYDVNGRVTKVVQPADSSGASGETTVQYDVKNDDGTTSDIITDALGRTSVTTYNTLMQTVSVADKGDGSVTAIQSGYTYNAKGLLERETTSRGTAATYEYDAKDRVTAIHHLNESGAEELRTCYTYDDSDNVKTMLDYQVSGGTATLYRYTGFTYDRFKRLTELVEMNTSTVPTDTEKNVHKTSYSYDIDGNLTKVIYPTSNDWNVNGLEYIYNADKWLTEIRVILENDAAETLRTYSYNNYGDVSEIRDYRVLSAAGTVVSNPAYTSCTYTYDDYLRPVSMAYTESTAPSVVMESYTFEYDKNSNIIKETLYNNYPTSAVDKQNEERTYTYDTDGKLLVTEVNDLLNPAESHTLTYTYDRAGNRLSQTKESAGDTETTEYSYNSLNQLLTSKTTDGSANVTAQKSYTYDADGNQTKETDSISNTEETSSYDAAGRLQSFVKKEAGTTKLTQTNQYNGAGARIRKTEGEEVTNYFYSQGSVLYTEDGSGAGTSLNLSGVSGNIIATAREEAGTESYYYYHKDASGSTTNLRNASGTSVIFYQYTDFGETIIGGDTDFYNEICYNGGIYDKSTGLYYLNARYYNPTDGRFISRDSYRGNLGNPSTLHLYVYCANNPVNYSDPSGHVAISRIIGGIVGGGVGAYVGSKIAKKTKATGLKKAAIIAGCTIAGAVVGALAGPKVAKVAKKAAKAVKKKVTSAAKKLKTTKKTVKKATKTKVSSAKKASKTKKVVTNTKVKATVSAKLTKAAKDSVKGSISGGISSKAMGRSGKDFRDDVLEGAINGFVSSVIEPKVKRKYYKNAIGGATASFAISMKNKQNIKHSLTKAAIAGITQGAAGGSVETIDEYIEWDMLESRMDVILGKMIFNAQGQALDIGGEAGKDVMCGVFGIQ